MIDTINDILICACAIVITLFCIFYHLSARWWNSREGQRVMISMIVISAVLDLTIVQMVVGQSSITRIVGAVIYGAGLVVSCSWVYLLYVVQVKGEPLTARMRRRVGVRQHTSTIAANITDIADQRGSSAHAGDDPPLYDALPGTSGQI